MFPCEISLALYPHTYLLYHTASCSSAPAVWFRKCDHAYSAISCCYLCLLNSPSREYGVHVLPDCLVRDLPGFLWPWVGSHLYSLSGNRMLSNLCTCLFTLNHRIWCFLITLVSWGCLFFFFFLADVIISNMLWPLDLENFSLTPYVEGIY